MENKEAEAVVQSEKKKTDDKTNILPIGGSIKYDDDITHEMGAKYSVLISGKSENDFIDKIGKWLEYGIKVLWFGDNKSCEKIKEKYKVYIDAYLLQVYVCCGNTGIIIDGNDESGLIDRLESACPFFNAAQYRVEHSKADEHIVVQASAGTGKTTVMIDRIMFLMHTVPDFHMYDIYMITFTNDATEEMNRRLQKALLTRYHLTGNIKYFKWVEEQSQMQISTIHSFCYLMLRQNGINKGFTENLSIKGLSLEKHKLISEVINSRTEESETIEEKVGESLYQTKALAEKYWDQFAKIGVSHNDIHNMLWGENFVNAESERFSEFIKETIPEIDDKFFEIKRKMDAISLSDIIRDLQVVLEGYAEDKDKAADKEDDTGMLRLNMKYLFIDEFQDTDLSQIAVAMLLVKLTNTRLFVVGDVKQSIYGFRGANDEAFDTFSERLLEIDKNGFRNYSLKNNYRTSKELMDSMDKYFRAWGKAGLLKYDNPVVPLNSGLDEKIEVYHCMKPKSLSNIVYEENEEDAQVLDAMKGKSRNNDPTQPSGEEIANITWDALDNLVKRIEESGKEPSEKDRVVLLTRTNNQLDELSMLLRKNKIPCVVRREGCFYKSEAVRDFYALICSYMFENDPKHIFNYLLTPYAGYTGMIDLKFIEELNGDRDKIHAYLKGFLDKTDWEKYRKEMRLRPVISVLKHILEDSSILDELMKNNHGNLETSDEIYAEEGEPTEENVDVSEELNESDNLEDDESSEKKDDSKKKKKDPNYIYNYIAQLKKAANDEDWDEKRKETMVSIRAAQYKANIYKLMEIIHENFGRGKTSLYDIYQFLRIQIATNRDEEEPNIRTQNDYKSVLCMTAHKSKGLEFDTIIIPYTGKRLYTKKEAEIIIDIKTKRVGWNGEGTNFCNEYYEELHDMKIDKERREEIRILYVAMTRAINRLTVILPLQPKDDTWASYIGN
ncbi:exodeoxyribonuclease V subunit beta [Butyrivibrio sp. INlla16]|uniref:UvrD-helicase domain-containing protein n=1 Tax=Butyrivibrio sp. INlla16 TaxID=1520807 RepID=UPI001A9A516C|nr:UvrD-helicase domain-containing protein [Butyrivibrio sp. INlla16]